MSPRLFLLLSVSFIIAGCANKSLEPYLENYADFAESVYVIDHGRHTALVVKSEDIIERIGLADTFYNSFRFIEIGRGDAGFYREIEPQISTTLKALFLSTPAVLHLRAYNYPPYKRYPLSHTLKIRLSRTALDKLMTAVTASFELENKQAIELSEGSDKNSRFFQASGTYHLFYSCNNWTADMIEQADYPISHRWAFFAGSVMRQVEAVQHELGLQCGGDGVYRCADESE
ncbi:MAG: DUF2459 domain-containing protein [Gammaproteobacteria bacterium]|nr:DUF2459 domain-containing protein [Gammaproteobacteria bacterium]